MPRGTLRSLLLEVSALALATALLAGVGVGLGSGWKYVQAGFPWVALEAVRLSVDRWLAGGLAFLLLYVGLFALLRRRGRGAVPAALLATASAAAPFGLYWAYRFNVQRALRPADLLEPHGLWPNLRLLGLFLVLLAAGGAALALWARRRLERDRPAPRAAILVLAALLVALNLAPALLARAAGAGEGPANVIVILVDALRADHLGTYGYPRATSPAIDAFAREAVVFEQAIAQSTFTKASIASLFTGRPAYQHGVYWGDRGDGSGRLFADVLPGNEVTLAEALRARRYLTAAWVQNSHLRASMGFAQGFVDYRDQQGEAKKINRRFLRWLRGPAGREAFFAYLHYIDLHDPYRPEPPYDTLFGDPGPVYEGIDLSEWGAHLEGVRRGRIRLSAADVESLRTLYDGQIRYLDERIGRLLTELRALGLFDRSLIVITSDHGDAFLEHGFISHSATPYEELIHVPLIVKLPGGRHAGRRVPRQVRLIDVVPTVLDVVGARVPRRVSGCTLLPVLEGSEEGWEEAWPSCSWAVTEIAEAEGEAPTLALRSAGRKYILGPRGEELYDLEGDPGERRDLAASAGPEALEPFRAIAREIAAIRARSRAGSVALDEQSIRELKALGYVQ